MHTEQVRSLVEVKSYVRMSIVNCGLIVNLCLQVYTQSRTSSIPSSETTSINDFEDDDDEDEDEEDVADGK